jgi:glutamyl-tRNA(Gln) amidotransferase subunit E
VAHTKWIPELTHNEAFRQWSLLLMRDMLKKKISKPANWKINSVQLNERSFKKVDFPDHTEKIVAVNLPKFEGALSWFTQPGKMYADEISDRLKVIACIEKPNMFHSEEFEPVIGKKKWNDIRDLLSAKEGDAQIVVMGPEEDMKTALETIEERCKMALEGIPSETRKSFKDGTTIFERVLPGADRMYPDTDSAPIPLEDKTIEKLKENLPDDIIERYKKLKSWGVPEDTYTFIFSKDYFPIMEKIINELNADPKFIGTFFGHALKYAEGQYVGSDDLYHTKIFKLFAFLKSENLNFQLAKNMLPEIVLHPKMDFESILQEMKFKKVKEKTIIDSIPLLVEKFNKESRKKDPADRVNWVMGQLRKRALGNMDLRELSNKIN